MHNEKKINLMRYRLEQAHDCLDSAIRDISAGSYKAASTRSYYCIFHTMRAVLAMDEFDSKKHSGVISVFRERYIKTGIFPKEFSDMIRIAFTNRGKSDYEDFFIISKEETAEQIENARAFLASVKEYLNTR